MNISDIDASLPWGLHDAYLEGLELDWLGATALLTVRVMMTERQDHDRRAQIRVAGLVFCTVDPPASPAKEPSGKEPGLWIDSGEGFADDAVKQRLPAVPTGCFVHWFFVNQWNGFIHICGREAHFSWLEPHAVAARASTRALFPGDDTG